MAEGVRSPLCGEILQPTLLRRGGSDFYTVKRFECHSCGSRFNLYESLNSKFTVPKARLKD